MKDYRVQNGSYRCVNPMDLIFLARSGGHLVFSSENAYETMNFFDIVGIIEILQQGVSLVSLGSSPRGGFKLARYVLYLYTAQRCYPSGGWVRVRVRGLVSKYVLHIHSAKILCTPGSFPFGRWVDFGIC